MKSRNWQVLRLALLLVAVNWIAAIQLTAWTEFAVPVKLSSMEYPLAALNAGIQGRVAISCTLSKEGKVESVSIVSGPKILAQAVEENVRSWVFSSGGSASLKYDFKIRGVSDMEDHRYGVAKFSFEYPDKITVTAPAPITVQ